MSVIINAIEKGMNLFLNRDIMHLSYDSTPSVGTDKKGYLSPFYGD